MNIKTLKYFFAICENGSFTKAAAAVGVAQPSLSLAMQRLEGELGGALFHRTADGVILTEFGSILRPHFKKLVRCADQALNAAARVQNTSLRDKTSGVPGQHFSSSNGRGNGAPAR